MTSQPEGQAPSRRWRSTLMALALIGGLAYLGSCATAAGGKCINSDGVVLDTGSLEHCQQICANPDGCTWRGSR